MKTKKRKIAVLSALGMAVLGLAVTSSVSTTYAYTPEDEIVQAQALSANSQVAHSGPKIDVTHLEGFDPATVKSGQEFEYMGLKYMWMGDRWYLENVDDPTSVETIVIPDDMAGYGCAVAYLKFEEYINLKNVYLFDNSNWYSHIASLELENLYLCTHLDLNSKYQGLTVKNLYLCCPYDAYYLSPSSSTKIGMSSYNVTKWYYASFMEDYFDDVAEAWRNYEECPINFQKVDMGTLEYDETEFYPYAGYLRSFTKSGVKYQTYNSSTGPIVAESTQYRILDIDPRVKSIVFPGKMTGLKDDFKQYTFEYVDARGTSTNSLEYIQAKNLVISNSGSAFYPSRMYSGLQKLYCVYDADSHLDISSIYSESTMSASNIYIKDEDKDHFTAFTNDATLNAKVKSYSGDITFPFMFEDAEGNIYKTSNYNADIDLCLEGIVSLKAQDLTVLSNFDLVFQQNNLPMTREDVKYTVSFNTNGVVTLEDVQVHSLSEIESPEVPGYTFNGWYLDSNYTTPAPQDYELTGDITLYAKFTLNTYDVTFNAGEGAQFVAINTNKLPTLPSKVVNGKYISGWYYDEALTEEVHKDDVLEANTTLYAKWAEETFEVKAIAGMYNSSTMDAKRLLGQTETGIVFYNGDDVTERGVGGYATPSGIDNTKDYEYTQVFSAGGKSESKSLTITVNGTLGDICYVVLENGDIYAGFNAHDYESMAQVKPKIETFITNVLNISNPSVELPDVNNIITKEYVGTYRNGKVKVIASGVDLRFSSKVKPAEETVDKSGYHALDNLIFTSDYTPEQAARALAPYLLEKDGIKVKDYKVEVKIEDSLLSFKYIVGEETVYSHAISYNMVESDYSYIFGRSMDYHAGTLILDKTQKKLDYSFNDLYKEAMSKAYSYMTDSFIPEYELTFDKTITKNLSDGLLQGNGIYYKVDTKVVVDDIDKLYENGAKISTIKDKDDKVLEYVPKTFTEKLGDAFESFKDRLEFIIIKVR